MFGCFAQDRACSYTASCTLIDTYVTVLIQLASYSVALPSIIPSTQIKAIAAVQILKSHERIALKLRAEAEVFVLRGEPHENVHKIAVQPR